MKKRASPIDERQAAGFGGECCALSDVELLGSSLALQLLGLGAEAQAGARHGPRQGHAAQPAFAVTSQSLHDFEQQ